MFNYLLISAKVFYDESRLFKFADFDLFKIDNDTIDNIVDFIHQAKGYSVRALFDYDRYYESDNTMLKSIIYKLYNSYENFINFLECLYFISSFQFKIKLKLDTLNLEDDQLISKLNFFKIKIENLISSLSITNNLLINLEEFEDTGDLNELEEFIENIIDCLDQYNYIFKIFNIELPIKEIKNKVNNSYQKFLNKIPNQSIESLYLEELEQDKEDPEIQEALIEEMREQQAKGLPISFR